MDIFQCFFNQFNISKQCMPSYPSGQFFCILKGYFSHKISQGNVFVVAFERRV